jgi:uncharacterized metal-binding protein
MSDGKSHLKNWWIGWIAEIPASVFMGIQVNPYIGIGSNVGYLLGRWVDCDMDSFGTTGAESRMVKELPIIGYVWFAQSSVYGAIFRSMHRSFITHFPGISTIIRLIFMFFWIGILYYFHWIVYAEWQGYLFLGVFIGLSYADTLHYLADILSSEFKKKRK